MPFKIISPGDRVSNRAWSDVDKAELRRRLVRGLEEREEGTRSAIREVYAVLLSDDLTEAPSTNWKLPHHEINRNGDVVLNTNGLSAAVGRLNQTDAPDEKIKKAANHFARHYRAWGREIPQSIKDIIGGQSKAVPQVITPAGGGIFTDVHTGRQVMPRSGSTMAMRMFTNLRPVEAAANPEIISLAQRKENWPDGRSEDNKFLYATFRALSAIIINPLTEPIDFQDEKILKRGTKMLKGRAFLKDHHKSIDSQIGSIQDTLWDEGQGKMPAGINALARVNLATPQAATVIPLIEEDDAKSVSVTVWFEWKKSHEDLDDWDFFHMLGEEVEGEMVRAIVTKILDMGELSLVWDGADPYAERIAAARDSGSYGVGLPTPTSNIIEDEKEFSETEDERKKDMNEKLKKALALVLAVEIDDINEEFVDDVLAGAKTIAEVPAVADLVKAEKEKAVKYAALAEEKNTKITELEADLKKSEIDAEMGRKFVQSIRDKAKQNYTAAQKAKGGEPREAILGIIDSASLDQAEALLAEYRGVVEAKIPLKCGECGSTKVSRAQSADEEIEGSGADAGSDEDENVI
jgi:hypothetical protein